MPTRDQHDMARSGHKRQPLIIFLESTDPSAILLQTRLLPLNPTSEVLPLPLIGTEDYGKTSPTSFNPDRSRTAILLRELPKSTRAFILDLRRQWLLRQQKAVAWFQERNDERRNERGILFIGGGVATLKLQCIRKIALDITQGDLRKAETIYEKVEKGWEFMHTMENRSECNEDAQRGIDNCPENANNDHRVLDYLGHVQSATQNEGSTTNGCSTLVESFVSETREASPIPSLKASSVTASEPCTPLKHHSGTFPLRPGLTFAGPSRFSSQPDLKVDRTGSRVAQIVQAYAVRLGSPVSPAVSQPGSLRPTSLVLLPPKTSETGRCTIIETKPAVKDIKWAAGPKSARNSHQTAVGDEVLYTKFRESGEIEWKKVRAARAEQPPVYTPTQESELDTTFRNARLSDSGLNANALGTNSVARSPSFDSQSLRLPESRKESITSSSSFVTASSSNVTPIFNRASATFDAFGVYNHTPTNLNFPPESKGGLRQDSRDTDAFSYRHNALFPSYRNLILADSNFSEGVIYFSEEYTEESEGSISADPQLHAVQEVFEKLLAAEYGKGHFRPVLQSRGLLSALNQYESRACTPPPKSLHSEVSARASPIEAQKSIIDCIQPTSVSTAAFLRDSYDARDFDAPSTLSGGCYASLTDLSIKSRKINLTGDSKLPKLPMYVQNEVRKFIQDLVVLRNEVSIRGIGYKGSDAGNDVHSAGAFVDVDDDERSLFEEDLAQEDQGTQDLNEEEAEYQYAWCDMFTCGFTMDEALPTVDMIVAVGKEGGHKGIRKAGTIDRTSLASVRNMTSNNNVIAERIVTRIEAMAGRERERLGLRKAGCISLKYLLSLARSRQKELLSTDNRRLLPFEHILPEIELYLSENSTTRVLVLEFDIDSRLQVEAILAIQRVLASPYPTDTDMFKIICVVDEMPQEGITGTVVDSSLYILEQSGPKPTTKSFKTPKGLENFKFPPAEAQATKLYTEDQQQLFKVTNVVVESGDGSLREPPHLQRNLAPALASINDALVARVAGITEDWILSSQERNGYTCMSPSLQGHSSKKLSCDSDSIMILPLQKRPPSLPLTVETPESYHCDPTRVEVMVSLADGNSNTNPGIAGLYEKGCQKPTKMNLEPNCSSPGSAHTFLEDSDSGDDEIPRCDRHVHPTTEFDIDYYPASRSDNPSDSESDRIFTDDEDDTLSEVFSDGYQDSIEDYAMVISRGYRPSSIVQRSPLVHSATGSLAGYSDADNITKYAWMSPDDHGRLKMQVLAAEKGMYLGRVHGGCIGPRLRMPGMGPRLHPAANNIKAMRILGLTD